MVNFSKRRGVIAFPKERRRVMTFKEVMEFLEEHGSEQTRKIYRNHGVKGEFYGVKVGDLKIVQKKVKKNHELSMQLYNTANYDAMYLAGLIADEKVISKAELQSWMDRADSHLISTYPVAWVAAESPYGLELAKEWIESENEFTAAGGYATYSSLINTKSNEELNLEEIEELLDHIVKNIHRERNQVRYQMNAFVIAAGGYIPELADKAKEYGERIGKVHVDMGNTSCKVPLIKPYIEKMEARGTKKKKKARC
jgi:3-methyladenine DNA glycosylase AlkD